MRILNLETLTDQQSWYKIKPLSGYSHTSVKPKRLSRRKRVHESSSSRQKSQKSSIQTIPWNLANLVKNYHGIIVHQRLTDLTRNGIAERAVRRIKEGTSAVLLQSGLDEKWWADAMECSCYLRNVQDLLADGKTVWRGSQVFRKSTLTRDQPERGEELRDGLRFEQNQTGLNRFTQ